MKERLQNNYQRLGVISLASLWPNRHQPRQGMYNWQQFSALSQMATMALVAPIPFTQLFSREQDDPAPDPFPVRRPVFWYAPGLARGLHGKLMLACSWQSLRSLAGRVEPKVFLANWAYPDGWAGIQAAERLGIPAVLQLLGSDINFMASDPVRRPYIEEALHQARLVTTVSAALRGKVLDLGVTPEKVVVLPNGVNTDLFKPRDCMSARRELGLPMDRKLVLFVGHLVPEKGPLILLEALAKLSKEVMLVMVGAGPLRKQLEAKLKGLDLSGRVRLAGEVSHQRISVLMAACDCLALPSLREGEPNAVLESLASGRPVAASKVGGVPRLIRDGVHGFLCEPGDIQDLARALTAALKHNWNSQVLAASVSGRTWQASAKNLLAILKYAAGVS